MNNAEYYQTWKAHFAAVRKMAAWRLIYIKRIILTQLMLTVLALVVFALVVLVVIVHLLG